MATSKRLRALGGGLGALPSAVVSLVFSFTTNKEWNALRQTTVGYQTLSLLFTSTPHAVAIKGALGQLPLSFQMKSLHIRRSLIARDLLWLLVNQPSLRALRFTMVSKLTEDLISVLTRLDRLSSLTVDRGARSPVAMLDFRQMSSLVTVDFGVMCEDLRNFPTSLVSLRTIWDGDNSSGVFFPNLTTLGVRRARLPLLQFPSLLALTLIEPLDVPQSMCVLPAALVALTLQSLSPEWSLSGLHQLSHLKSLRFTDIMCISSLDDRLFPWPGCVLDTITFDHAIDSLEPFITYVPSLARLVVPQVRRPYLPVAFTVVSVEHHCLSCVELSMRYCREDLHKP
jgi:hypothetical protein